MKRYCVVYELKNGDVVHTCMYANSKPTRRDVQNMAYAFDEGPIKVKSISLE